MLRSNLMITGKSILINVDTAESSSINPQFVPGLGISSSSSTGMSVEADATSEIGTPQQKLFFLCQCFAERWPRFRLDVVIFTSSKVAQTVDVSGS